MKKEDLLYSENEIDAVFNDGAFKTKRSNENKKMKNNISEVITEIKHISEDLESKTNEKLYVELLSLLNDYK